LKYICAFRGRRDDYQVPIALAEVGRLDCLVTDHYCGPGERAVAAILPHRLGEALRSRCNAALPAALVRQLRSTAAAEGLARLAARPPIEIYERFDPHYGEVAAQIARRHKSNLFMYSPHAWAAFNARYRHEPHKLLFQFHPHHLVENEILEADRKVSEQAGVCFAAQVENLHQDGVVGRLRGDSAWQFAHHVVCASDFTRRSLIEVGARPEQISVIPYGVDVEPNCGEEVRAKPSEEFRALFVGNGIQRKGLHHLLRAWKRARLPAEARLTVVARVIDPGLEPLLASTSGVDLKRGVTRNELRELYATSTLFCMPSLVEGFGQVYLEALASGLPILGTPNTCCTDLGTEADGVFVTSAGELDDLISALERLARTLPSDDTVRHRARACAARFTWAAFRRQIQATASLA
jgi:glycosyltransferase involved in cell wall biosynthesis